MREVHAHIGHPNETPTTTVVMSCHRARSGRGARRTPRVADRTREPASEGDDQRRRAKAILSISSRGRTLTWYTPNASIASAESAILVVVPVFPLGGDNHDRSDESSAATGRVRIFPTRFLTASSSDRFFSRWRAWKRTRRGVTLFARLGTRPVWCASDCPSVVVAVVAAGHQLGERRTASVPRLVPLVTAPRRVVTVPCRWHSLWSAA